MADSASSGRGRPSPDSVLAGPPVDTAFDEALDDLIAVAKQGQPPSSSFFNPSDDWLIGRMRIFQDLPSGERERTLEEARRIAEEAKRAAGEGRAAGRVWPDVALRLDSGGLAFFSQLGVARRPDLTQYFIDGFCRNRDSEAFSEENQSLFAEVIPHITARLRERFAAEDAVVQCDRQIGDAPGRSLHARHLLLGTRYLQLPYMWRQLTFDLPAHAAAQAPDILEVSAPNWLDDLGLPERLRTRIEDAGLTQLILKAPTKGLSLHLGFDYMGEHKMGPLSIAMFQVKQAGGVAIQAALSMARVKTVDGRLTNTALVTTGPSLHGKSTLTIMIELANSNLAGLLDLKPDPEEGVYPMNDDIVLLQRLAQPLEAVHHGRTVRISHGIDGTENSFYAVPFGLTRDDDPITYDVLRGPEGRPNSQETLENVVVDPDRAAPDFSQNPVRNMRMILSRSRLIERKGSQRLLEAITDGRLRDSVHVPMEHMDQIFWQGVMRQNTVIPPLRRLKLEQYIRVLMYGEAVQMGAATGAIGKPYVEYFSDPFIIGLEDDNANLMFDTLQEMEDGGLPQKYYVFNTGGVGAETNEQASGPRYKKIERELTLMLQEALLRGAVKFEYDRTLRSEVAVAVVNQRGEEALDLRKEWLPQNIYGEEEYCRRIEALSQRRYYGHDAEDKAGILRYTKVKNEILDLEDIPPPATERELAWLLSFFWSVDRVYPAISELTEHRREGQTPAPDLLRALQRVHDTGVKRGLRLPGDSRSALESLGFH